MPAANGGGAFVRSESETRRIMLQRIAVSIIACMLFTASACGLEHAYHTITPNLVRSGGAQVTVGVHDQRRAVLDGDADPDYVGLVRSGWGIPYHVSTDSDAPLSHDLADVIARGLARAGHEPKVVHLLPTL